MRFEPLSIDGAYRVEPELLVDHRGFFARIFCEEEFAEAGLPTRFSQSSISASQVRGTLRGIHYRDAGHEAKLIRCTAGAVFDVLVDLRPGSRTFGRWEALHLTAANHHMVFIPSGCAHGHQALTDDVELEYSMTVPYVPGELGIRWDDPTLAVDWPMAPTLLSEKDANLPALADLDLLDRHEAARGAITARSETGR